jgi:hypothetical protein
VNVNLTDERYQLLAGPSIAFNLFSNFSVGLSVFHVGDSQRTIFNVQQDFIDGSVSASNSVERIRTRGVLPILGLQYVPTEKLSIGLSIRKKYYSKPIISTSEYIVSSDNLFMNPENSIHSFYVDGNSDYRTTIIGTGNQLIISSPYRGNFPNIHEIRFGLAWFANKRLILSTDWIHTSGYRKKFFDYNYDIFNKTLFFSFNDTNSLKRRKTNNFSVGMEYFFLENLAIRLGYFTNFSNNDLMNWRTGAAIMILENNIGTSVPISSNLYLMQNRPRSESVDIFGATIGLGYSSGKNSISVSYSQQEGKGISIIEVGKLPQIQRILNRSVYFVASTGY